MMTEAHQGAHRQFSAFARPRGDAEAGIAGPLVEIHERAINAGRGVRKLKAVRVLSHAEAAQLHYELGEALRAFDLARDMAGAVAAEISDPSRPRAATDPYPFRNHGTLADVGFMDASGECAA